MMIKINDKSDFSELNAGDFVLFSGKVYTARDKAHKRLLKESLPIDNSVIYHCGPLINKKGGKFELISAGPTTSARMEEFLPGLIRKYSIKAFIGKGFLDEKSLYGSVYLVFTGGCGALASRKMRVLDVFWPELGFAEAVWVLEAADLPLVVAVDSKGVNLLKSTHLCVK